jgi:predicted O-methyltransferase YrrM
MQDIYLRNVPPPSRHPLETYDHVGFLYSLAEWIRPERYLELGVRDGRCFKQISSLATEAIAIDVAPLSFTLPENATYLQMYTDEYFEQIRDSDIVFDMVFIDADHSFEQSYKDFLNVKDKVIPDGFVFFHDTYPYEEFMIAPQFSNNCYKTAIEIRNNFHNEWEVLTLPFNPGVSIAKKIYNPNGLPWMK